MQLDYREDLKLSAEEEENNYESRMALARLAEGLFWTYRQLKNLENEARRLANEDKDEKGHVPIAVVTEVY